MRDHSTDVTFGIRTLKASLLRSAGGIALVCAAFLPSTVALAQSDQPSSAVDLETVTVTATRIVRPDYQAPTPTIAVSSQELAIQADLNAVDYLNNLPQMTPTQADGGSTGIGENRVNFRNLGPVRTLVLIDNRRVGYTDPFGGVDLNIIPASLLQSIEVVSGGASADWGSDAIAGVVNFHLNSQLEGVKGNVQCGETSYGDGEQCGGSLGLGTSFANGHGHAVLAVDVLDNNGIEVTTNRKWGAPNYALITNPAYVAGNGQPDFITSQNACYSTMTPGGLITSGPLKGTQFGVGGVAEPFVYGTDPGSVFMNGGTCSPAMGRNVSPTDDPLKRQSEFSRITYDLSSSVSVYLEVLNSHTSAEQKSVDNYNAGTLTVSSANAFLPPSIKSLMTANNITSFSFGRIESELSDPTNAFGIPEGGLPALGLPEYEQNQVDRYVVGGKGSFGGGWTWDAYAQYSLANYYTAVPGVQNLAKWALSVNSEISPTTGQPICVDTLTHPTDGCVPVDLFGPGSITPAVAQYAAGTATYDTWYTQRVAAANVQGEPFSLPAGPVSIAAGFEARNESLVGISDATSAALGWRIGNNTPINGKYNVEEGYLETVVPIVKGMPLAYNLELNAAGRITSYSTSGVVETWKLGLNYTPFDDSFRLRGTWSTDIRAPTLSELYAGQVAGGLGTFDPVCNCTSLAQNFTAGNPNLKPEVAHTVIVGAVMAPAILPGFEASIDGYDIVIADAITALSAANTVLYCYDGIQSACAGVVRNPAITSGSNITLIEALEFNTQSIEREGVDVESTYQADMADLFDGVPGSINLHLLGNYVTRNISTLNGVATETAGQVGVPVWHGDLSITYNLDKWTYNVLADYVGPGIISKADAAIASNYLDNNHVQERTYFNGTVAYELQDGVQMFAAVYDIFNVEPPILAGSAASSGGIGTSSFYDYQGRRYKAGVRFSF